AVAELEPLPGEYFRYPRHSRRNMPCFACNTRASSLLQSLAAPAMLKMAFLPLAAWRRSCARSGAARQGCFDPPQDCSPMIRTSYALVAALLLAAPATAQEPIRLARTPDISPDGKLIAFSYLGDIWVVDSIGGAARPVTMHRAHDLNPIFSPDGKWLAF